MISRIGQAARAGRFDEAALLATHALAEDPDDTTLPALAGAVEFHRRQFARATEYLEKAIAYHPEDLVIRCNLAESLYHSGRAAEALALCDKAHAISDRSLRLARLGGYMAQQAGNYDDAVALYSHVVDKVPSDWEGWNNLGNARAGAGDFEGSIEALKRAVSLVPDSRPVRLNLANGLFDAGQVQEAERLLKELVTEEEGDPAPFLSLYTLYRAAGCEEDAYHAIKSAALAAPRDASIQSDLGQEAARYNYYDEAESAFEKALSLDARMGPPFVGLASIYERMNREDELLPLRDRAEAAQIDDEHRAYIDALCHKRAGNMQAAFDALERSGDVVVPGRKFHLRGTLLDRLGRPQEAIDAFKGMNEHWLQDPTLPTARAREYREMVQRGIDILTPQWVSSWKPCSLESSRPDPIFLVGFPRSGTTLLDTMLMAEPNTLVLEEEAFIAEAESLLGGIEALPELDEKTLSSARDIYFEKVAKRGSVGSNTVIVDKHPMHLNKIPVIKRLFPNAKFVLILRHPCDVLLSCYLTNFRLNKAMSNFLDIDDAATLYDLTFTNWEKACSSLDLPVYTVVYERLVADQRRELAPLFDWLGFNTPDETFDHRAAARARGTVRTASYSQVTEPVYTRAAGRWRRYRDFLEPVIPKLAPWIIRFDYGIDDDRVPAWPTQGRDVVLAK